MNHLFLQEIHFLWDRLDPNSYVRQIPALTGRDFLTFDNNITFFAGENGSGKSTLLEAIAVSYGFNPEGGTPNYRFSSYDSHSDLHQILRLVKGPRKPKNSYFLRAESFYNVATKAEEYRDGDDIETYYRRFGSKSFHQQSHGESFLALMQGTFTGQGFYILDEPEAALSPQRQLTLFIQLHRLAGLGAQFLIASHSPILLGIPGASILSFDNGVITPCSYEETESYQVTEMFINQRDYFVKKLLSD